MSEETPRGAAEFVFDSTKSLAAPVTPVVSAEILLAIDEVRLCAGAAPRRVLREFYEEVLGLTFVQPNEKASDGEMRFVYERRRVVLERERKEPGRLGLLVKNFGEALLRLRERGIGYELIHTDGGLTRLALARDPAGNWIHLVETRPF